MLLDVCFGSKSVWRILVLYGESPGAGFTRQDLREHTKLGNRALSFALKRLVTFNILGKEKKIYKLDMGNDYVNYILSILSKEKRDMGHLPYDFGLITREFSRKVIDAVDVISIYLFGSVAKRTYRKDSDIDFAIVLKDKNAADDMKISMISEELSGRFKRKIQYFILTPNQLIKKSELTEEILKHGIKMV